jgi:hypothetical protein
VNFLKIWLRQLISTRQITIISQIIKTEKSLKEDINV